MAWARNCIIVMSSRRRFTALTNSYIHLKRAKWSKMFSGNYLSDDIGPVHSWSAACLTYPWPMLIVYASTWRTIAVNRVQMAAKAPRGGWH